MCVSDSNKSKNKSKSKQVIVFISSSEEDEKEDASDGGDYSGNEEFDDSDCDEDDESDEQSDDEEFDDSDYDDDDESDEQSDGGDYSEPADYADLGANRTDGDEICDKAVDLLRRGKSLDILKLEDCKVYLRNHGLRVSGNKDTCIKRILEHWRIKDGNGESFYPRSSFCINCTGDVCKGDVILFKQRVYNKFDKARRGANIIGKRTVAGRVVKESYGARKQQHTFTIEVLWSKGVKALSPFFPLLVKGRNLYRLKTFRQCWHNEKERERVLTEKHKRGAVARHIRSIAKAKSSFSGSKRRRNRNALDSKSPRKKKRINRADFTNGGISFTNKNRVNKRKNRQTANRTRQTFLHKSK